MPLYFAYGSNMDMAAMHSRCPRSSPLGVARLMRHRFTIMAEGYANVVRDPRGVVYGVLWDLALCDVRALDAYENVGNGLYRKVFQSVFRQGAASRALIYIGRGVASGTPRAGYMEAVVAAARGCGLPDAYVAELETHIGGRPALRAHTLEQTKAAPAIKRVRALRDESGNIKVRPRFSSPLERERS